MTAASRSLATALWRARFASGLLRPTYTTGWDTTHFGSVCNSQAIDPTVVIASVAWRSRAPETCPFPTPPLAKSLVEIAVWRPLDRHVASLLAMMMWTASPMRHQSAKRGR